MGATFLPGYQIHVVKLKSNYIQSLHYITLHSVIIMPEEGLK